MRSGAQSGGSQDREAAKILCLQDASRFGKMAEDFTILLEQVLCQSAHILPEFEQDVQYKYCTSRNRRPDSPAPRCASVAHYNAHCFDGKATEKVHAWEHGYRSGGERHATVTTRSVV